MNDPASDGIHLTKEYYKDFLPTDLQWAVSKIDDDFTLYDLFRLVYHANQIIPGIFATMGMLEFNAFWEQIQLDPDPNDDDNIEYLELYWHASYDARVVKKTGKPTDQPHTTCTRLEDGHNYWDDPKICDLSNLMSFHGIGPGCPSKYLDFHECGDDCPRNTTYAIEFTPLNNLAHLPIRVLPKVNFYPPYVESDRNFNRTEFELTIEPTLWCFITSIFWELTFAGPTPNRIADRIEEIIGRKTEIEKQLDKEDNE